MAIKEMINEIDGVVADILQKDFEIVKSQGHLVPGYEDPNLTFERGQKKKAKTIETCVLYADIRNSTALSHQHSAETMARLYTAFTKSLLLIAEEHKGVVRNIIGDRVMMVFPQNDCFKNAVYAAISINTVSKRIDQRFPQLKFACGIGIDFGEMLVVKAGIPKQEPERTNYKNLIWIGKPANIASKLTDVANKTVEPTVFRVTYYPYTASRPFALLSALVANKRSSLPSANPSASPVVEKYTCVDELTEMDFAAKIGWTEGLGITYAGGKFVKFEKVKKSITDPPILFTSTVFNEFKRLYPTDSTVKNECWKMQTVKVKDYTGQIYGGDVYWTL